MFLSSSNPQPVGEGELTGATNLMAHYGLEHSYSKFSGKKVKEQLSSFLPNLPGVIDGPGHLVSIRFQLSRSVKFNRASASCATTRLYFYFYFFVGSFVHTTWDSNWRNAWGFSGRLCTAQWWCKRKFNRKLLLFSITATWIICWGFNWCYFFR